MRSPFQTDSGVWTARQGSYTSDRLAAEALQLPLSLPQMTPHYTSPEVRGQQLLWSRVQTESFQPAQSPGDVPSPPSLLRRPRAYGHSEPETLNSLPSASTPMITRTSGSSRVGSRLSRRSGRRARFLLVNEWRHLNPLVSERRYPPQTVPEPAQRRHTPFLRRDGPLRRTERNPATGQT
jgi:hypothetical protein